MSAAACEGRVSTICGLIERGKGALRPENSGTGATCTVGLDYQKRTARVKGRRLDITPQGSLFTKEPGAPDQREAGWSSHQIFLARLAKWTRWYRKVEG